MKSINKYNLYFMVVLNLIVTVVHLCQSFQVGLMWDDIAVVGMLYEQFNLYMGDTSYSSSQNIVHGSTFPFFATIFSCTFSSDYCSVLISGNIGQISIIEKNRLLLNFFNYYHLFISLSFILSILLISFIVYKKYNNLHLSAVTFLIGLSWPNLMGHGMFNSVDMPIFFGFILIWTYFTFNSISQYNLKFKLNVILKSKFIFIFGSILILGTRPPLFFLVILIYLTMLILDKKKLLQIELNNHIFVFLLIGLIFLATNPYFIYFLFKNPESIFLNSFEFPSSGKEMFANNYFQTDSLPILYYISIFLSFIPDIYLFFLFIGLFIFLKKLRFQFLNYFSVDSVMIFYILFIPLLAILIIQPNIYNNGRQLLFMFLPIFFLVIFSIQKIIHNYLINLLIIIFCSFLIYINFLFYPYNYSLRNFISYKFSQNLLSNDYWALSMKEISTKIPTDHSVVSIENNFPNPEIYFRNFYQVPAFKETNSIPIDHFFIIERSSTNYFEKNLNDRCVVFFKEERNFLKLININYAIVYKCVKV